MYLTSFVLLYCINQFFTAYIGTTYDLDSIIYYWGVRTQPQSGIWIKRGIIVTYSAGPLLLLALGLIFRRLHSVYLRKMRGMLKLFFNWLYLHAFLFFFGATIVGVILGQGFGHALLWAFIPYPMLLFLAIMSLAFLVFIGMASTRSFLQNAQTSDLLEEGSNRIRFIMAVSVFPYITGSVFLFLLRYPENTRLDVSLWLMMIPVLIPVLSFANAVRKVSIVRDLEVVNINWRFIAICVTVLLGYRIGLMYGVELLAPEYVR